MGIILFSTDTNTIDEWTKRYELSDATVCYDLDTLKQESSNEDRHLFEKSILVCDYDTVASELNSLISSKTLPFYTVVLERMPAIATGKMLIKNGIRAYGNSKMSSILFKHLLEVVSEDNTWTYPELTAALVKSTKKSPLNKDAQELIDSRLTDKEKDVVLLVLDGLTNDAIANELDITTRTVKAHVGSIFSKLHVNDRISLVLLLK